MQRPGMAPQQPQIVTQAPAQQAPMQGGNPAAQFGLSPEAFQELVANMEPSEREQFMQTLYTDPVSAMGMVKERISRGRGMERTPTPRGRRAGRTYNAANPLEHIGAGMQRYHGMTERQGGLEDWRGQQGKTADMLRKIGGAFSGVK